MVVLSPTHKCMHIHELPLTSVEAVSDPLRSQTQTGVQVHAQHSPALSSSLGSCSSPAAEQHSSTTFGSFFAPSTDGKVYSFL